MSERRMCDEKEQLLEYLYGDGAEEDRQQIAAHVAACSACAHELDALRGVRGHLATWTPPELALGFKVVREQTPRRQSWFHLPVPAWGLAMAASLVLIAAMAVARLEVRFVDGALVVRSAWAEAAGAPAARPASTSVGPEWRRELASLEQRLRAELTGARPNEPEQPASLAAGKDPDVLRRVRTLVEQSEQRQKQELALRLAQVVQDFDRQRQVDLIRIQQGFGRIEGQNTAEAARQRETLNYLMRVSQRP